MIKYLHCFEMDIDIGLGTVSMGQKKKVFMSFALATNTSLLLMDEPTNGLDIPGKSQFRKFIASGMSDDKTIVISTHQVRDIDKAVSYTHLLLVFIYFSYLCMNCAPFLYSKSRRVCSAVCLII